MELSITLIFNIVKFKYFLHKKCFLAKHDPWLSLACFFFFIIHFYSMLSLLFMRCFFFFFSSLYIYLLCLLFCCIFYLVSRHARFILFFLPITKTVWRLEFHAWILCWHTSYPIQKCCILPCLNMARLSNINNREKTKHLTN